MVVQKTCRTFVQKRRPCARGAARAADQMWQLGSEDDEEEGMALDDVQHAGALVHWVSPGP